MLRTDKVADWNPEDWDKKYEEERKYLTEYRDIIKEKEKKEGREAALKLLSKIDGYISLPLIMQNKFRIKQFNEAAIISLIKTAIKKDIRREYDVKNIDEVLAEILKKDVRDIFKELTEKTPISELTEEKVNSTIENIIEGIWNSERGLKARFPALEGFAPVLSDLLRNQIFLACSLKLYEECDRRQVAGWLKIKALMAPFLLNKDALQTPFIGSIFSAKIVKMLPETVELWKEVQLLLEGLYWRSFYQIPEENRQNGIVTNLKDGTPPRVVNNPKDGQLFETFKVTLLQLATYHRNIAAEIAKRYDQVIPMPGAAPGEDAESNPVTCELVSGPESRLIFTVPKGHEREYFGMFATVSAATSKEVAVKMKGVGQNDIMMSADLHWYEQTEQCRQLAARFSESHTERAKADLADVKINKLEECVSKYQLTKLQETALKFIKGRAERVFKVYEETRAWKVPLLGWKIMSAYHARETENTLTNMSLSSSKKDQLRALFDLRRILKGDASNHLIYEVNDILMEAYDSLRDIAPPSPAAEIEKSSPRMTTSPAATSSAKK